MFAVARPRPAVLLHDEGDDDALAAGHHALFRDRAAAARPARAGSAAATGAARDPAISLRPLASAGVSTTLAAVASARVAAPMST
jgi:hypothetical protein